MSLIHNDFCVWQPTQQCLACVNTTKLIKRHIANKKKIKNRSLLDGHWNASSHYSLSMPCQGLMGHLMCTKHCTFPYICFCDGINSKLSEAFAFVHAHTHTPGCLGVGFAIHAFAASPKIGAAQSGGCSIRLQSVAAHEESGIL
jgi:hypothetical protein